MDDSRRWAASLAVVYTFSIAAAFFSTYLPRYFVSVGWTSAGIGLVLGVATVVRVVMMPTWARIAERTSSTTRVIRIAMTLGVVTLWILPFVETTWAVYALFCAMYGTWNAFIPLADSLTVRQLGSESFGRIRAYGSAGFGVAAIVVAVLAAGRAHEVVAGWAPWLMAVLGTISALAAWLFPRGEVAIRAPDLPEALRLLRRPALLFCFPLWALHWASQAPYNLFLVFLAEDRGMDGWVPGVAVAAGIIAEAIMLWRGRKLVDRFGPATVFAACALVTAGRWGLTAIATSELMVVLLQLCHGVTFGVFLLSAMAVLDREVRAEVRDSGQAVFYVIVFGGGSALGNTVSGWLDDRFGAAHAFAAAAGLELVVFVGAAAYALSVVRRLSHKR